MDLGIRGKTALVVAASKGMGKASALGLGAEGARVVMCARGEGALKDAAAEVKQKTGAEVLALPADASRAADISRVVAEANRAFGGVDILVANVGGPPPGPFEAMTDDQWKAAFEQVHLSTVRFIREVLPHMKRSRWGRILAIQSVSVKEPLGELLLSNAVRPGVHGMMKTLSRQLGQEGILVNTLCPGRILTDRLMGGLKGSGLSREEYLSRQSADIPLARPGTAEEFANVAVFLASERASYVTGVSLQIDGGLVRGLL